MNEPVPEEVPVYYDLIEVAGDPEALMTSPPLARQQAEEARLLKRLLKLSRDARLRIRLALQMLEEE